jgi:hypothetical protein
MKTTATICLLLGAMALSGCNAQFHARSAEDYRKVTRQLLETRSEQIKKCYQDLQATDPKAKGTVVVHFNVFPDTGEVKNAQVLPESTAPPALGQCVVNAINGLVLDPPDNRLGDATFTYEFSG